MQNRREMHLLPLLPLFPSYNPSLVAELLLLIDSHKKTSHIKNDSDQIVSLAQVVQPILSTYQGGDKSLTNFRSRGPAEAGQRSKRER